MKVLVVAKTRRGGGACVGGITASGRSVRLIAHNAANNERAGLEYEIGEVWEIESEPDPAIIPPHVENIIVQRARRLRCSDRISATIHRFMPPIVGGLDRLFDGLLQYTASGGLYIAKPTGLPHRSTMFWVPDQPLQLDCEGKRLRYRYPTPDGGRTLTFVGFQEPLPEIPASTLLRVSLAHWWRPRERPEEELRCFVQLSGWFPEAVGGSARNVRPCGRPVRLGPPAIGASAETPEASVPKTTLPGASPRAGAVGGAPSVPEQCVRDILRRTFGFSDFLPLQAEVITRILQRQDALVVMPTGGGKSLCYQLPSMLFDGLTVVVSPLVALMQDQVSQLSRIGVAAACLNHMVPLREYTSITNRIRQGRIKLVYLAPETLLRPETLVLLQHSRLACLAIDEAHCISEWGHDFRPEYRQLQGVRRCFPTAVCLALTATATPRVRQDVRRLLGIPADGEFVDSFNRPNLFLSVEPRLDVLAQTLGFLEEHRRQCGIIYCGTRKQADELCAALNANGWPSLPYHAGLDDAVRTRNHQRFIRNEISLMVATVAFGMGINKANVRFVLHAHLPKDLESYYQEIGRAGRDGQRADCLLLFSHGDAMVHRHFIKQGAESERRGREARLRALLRFAEARDCRRRPLLDYFGESLGHACGHCDNCVQTATNGLMTDVTSAAQKFLSCVKLTGQLFGVAHIIAVLRGSRAERVLQRGHERLAAFGVGKEHSAKMWGWLAQQFVRLGLLDQDLEFGGLRLAPRGRKVLDGNERILLPLARTPGAVIPKSKSERSTSTEIVRPVTRHRFHEIGERFAAGQNLEQIARAYNILPATVVQNLYRFHQSGGPICPERLLKDSRLNEPERARVLAAFKRLGYERLAPVYQAFSGAIPYDELHLLRLYSLCRDDSHPQ